MAMYGTGLTAAGALQHSHGDQGEGGEMQAPHGIRRDETMSSLSSLAVGSVGRQPSEGGGTSDQGRLSPPTDAPKGNEGVAEPSPGQRDAEGRASHVGPGGHTREAPTMTDAHAGPHEEKPVGVTVKHLMEQSESRVQALGLPAGSASPGERSVHMIPHAQGEVPNRADVWSSLFNCFGKTRRAGPTADTAWSSVEEDVLVGRESTRHVSPDSDSPSFKRRQSEVKRRASDVSSDVTEGLIGFAKKARQKNSRRYRYVVMPDGPRKIAWDAFVGLLILYSVIMIPLRLAFFKTNVRGDAVLHHKYIEWMIDLIFFIDICISFTTGFYKEDQNGVRRLVRDRREIRKTYLKGWFTVDFLSTMPFDLVYEELFPKSSDSVAIMQPILRMVRLLKLMRLARLQRKLSHMWWVQAINPAAKKMLVLMMTIFFVAHLLACLWYSNNNCPGRLAGTNYTDIYYDDDEHATIYSTWKMCGHDTLDSRYLAAVYWTIATMMAVGYGDVNPTTVPERICAIAAQIVGATAFGFIIVKVTDIVETLDPHATLTRQKMDEIREYMRERQLSRVMQRQIREHFEYYFEMVSVFRDMRILSELPYSQRVKIMFEAHGPLVQGIRFFAELDVVMLSQVISRLKPQFLDYKGTITQDTVISEQIYFLARGMLEMWITERDPTSTNAAAEPPKHVMIGVLTAGSEFEFVNALRRVGMLAEYRAAEVCEIWWISLADFQEFLEDHPDIVGRLQDMASAFEEKVDQVLSSPILRHGQAWMKEKILVDSMKIVEHNKVGDVKDLDETTPKEHHIRTLRVQDPKKRHRTVPILERGATGSTKSLFSGRQTIRNSYFEGLEESGGLSKSLRRKEQNWIEKTLGCGAPVIEDEETPMQMMERGIIDHTHARKLQWDMAVGVMIITSVIVMPFRLGFFIDADTIWWQIYDGIIDAIFGLDILLNFRTTYLDENMTHVTVPEMIMARYIKGWFLVDLVSVMPFRLFGSKSQRKRNMLWKLLRALRLFKLVKVFNNNMKFLRGDYFEMHTSLVRCFKLMLTLLFLAHLFGCFWSYTAGEAMQTDPNDDSIVSWWTNDAMNSHIFQDADDWTGHTNLAQRYVASIYWAFTTMTTVGYGDIVPSNDAERVYATIIMVLGATVFGYVVGSVSAIANNQNSAMAKEAEVTQRVMFHMAELNLSSQLRESVKMTVNYILTRKSAFNEQQILENMPADLRRDCVLASHHDIIPHVAIFQNQSPTLVAHMITLMRPIFHAAGDIIYRPQDGADGIYFLLNGIAEQTSLHEVPATPTSAGEEAETVKELEVDKILHVGSFFGHEGFLVPERDQKKLMIGARAFTSCSLYVLLERDIASVSIRHRFFGEQLRAALKDAILRVSTKKAAIVPRKGVGLAGAMMAAAQAQQRMGEDDNASKRIMNAIDDLPRRIMARRKSTKVELAKLYRRDHRRPATVSSDALSGTTASSVSRTPMAEEEKELEDKNLEMDIAHSTSHNSLQSHEDTKEPDPDDHTSGYGFGFDERIDDAEAEGGAGTAAVRPESQGGQLKEAPPPGASIELAPVRVPASSGPSAPDQR